MHFSLWQVNVYQELSFKLQRGSNRFPLRRDPHNQSYSYLLTILYVFSISHILNDYITVPTFIINQQGRSYLNITNEETWEKKLSELRMVVILARSH